MCGDGDGAHNMLVLSTTAKTQTNFNHNRNNISNGMAIRQIEANIQHLSNSNRKIKMQCRTNVFNCLTHNFRMTKIVQFEEGQQRIDFFHLQPYTGVRSLNFPVVNRFGFDLNILHHQVGKRFSFEHLMIIIMMFVLLGLPFYPFPSFQRNKKKNILFLFLHLFCVKHDIN